MRDESQNALLKTLEEPPGFAHLILLSSEPEALLETISSRCQPVEFAPLPPTRSRRRSTGDPRSPTRGGRRRRPARRGRPRPGPLPAQDAGRRELRPRPSAAGRRGARRRARRRPPGGSCWTRRGRPARTPRRRLARRSRRRRRPGSSARPATSTDEAKRAGRRRRTEVLDLGLGSARPGSATSPPSPPAPRTSSSTATGSPSCAPAPRASTRRPARRAAELVQDTRRRLDLNVSEELALEALCFRLEDELEA